MTPDAMTVTVADAAALADAAAPDAATPDAAMPDATPCVACTDVINDPTAEPDLCASSAPIYADLWACACEGACMLQCADNACVGAPPSIDCQLCVIDASGCATQYSACTSDQ